MAVFLIVLAVQTEGAGLEAGLPYLPIFPPYQHPDKGNGLRQQHGDFAPTPPPPTCDPALRPLPWRLTSFLRSLSLWMSQRTDAWGDFGKHSRKVVLFSTPYWVISTAFL